MRRNILSNRITIDKTAEQIETGNISQQQLTEATIGDLPIVNFNLTNTQIIVPKLSCFINNNALEINLGRLKPLF